ncbi:TIGR02450 family Trp-rich protein [Pseudomonas sp.]|uniref:TIGR02450 family Trp-rich protein n=1 Tax=Pseudomonas sp. TaxID=306 RepID=UPI0028B1B020|nr:TIGR02450 family Trp-rich protein [Pseudomonas sp.]
MNRFNPAKLKLSKWTATQPQNREKHFLVTDLEHDEHSGELLRVELQAVYSKRSEWLDWRVLRDAQVWAMGWR